MELQDYFKGQMEHYTESIRKILQSDDKDQALLSYYFLRMLEMKARLERLGETVNTFVCQSCWNDLQPYRKSLLELYEANFDLHLPEKVRECALRVDENLELLAPDAENDEEKEDKKGEIIEECFNLLIERETLELIQGEMAKLYPDYGFENVKSILSHMDRTFRNVYLPHEAIVKIQEYTQNNKVDIGKMTWFSRPSINEIPPLLECEMEEIEAEALLEECERNPIPVPQRLRRRQSFEKQPAEEKSEIIAFFPSTLRAAAASASDTIEQKLQENISLLQQTQKPLYHHADEQISLKFIHNEGKFCGSLFAKTASKTLIEVECGLGEKTLRYCGEKYIEFDLGSETDLANRTLTVTVYLNQECCFKNTFSFQPEEQKNG